MAGNKRIGSHRGKGKGVCKTKWAQTHLRGEKKGGKKRKMKTNKKRSTTHQERLSWKEKEAKKKCILEDEKYNKFIKNKLCQKNKK
ncbi:hypothetical protein KKF47_03140 [Patescibacteria group bacterium]|nr:hypothetical protein [Patescibacteria group bacterium]